MVIGGTPAFNTVFEATNESPQKITVPQMASKAEAREGAWMLTSVRMVKIHATRTGLFGQRLVLPYPLCFASGRLNAALRSKRQLRQVEFHWFTDGSCLRARSVGSRMAKYADMPHGASGRVIASGRTHSSNCSAVTYPSFTAASRSVRSSRYAFRDICAAFS